MRWFLAILIIAAFSPSAVACGCAKPDSIDELNASRTPDYVFEGRVTSVATSTYWWGKSQNVTFEIEKLVHGEPIKVLVVRFDAGGTSCDLEALKFKAKQRYLISASEDQTYAVKPTKEQPGKLVGTGTYSNHYCDLRKRLRRST